MPQRHTVALQVLLMLGAALAALYAIAYVIPLIPESITRIADAALAALVLYVVFRLLVRALDAGPLRSADPGVRNTVNFAVTLIGYGVIGLAVAAALGVDVSSIILGSAFASVILGLAAQTVLSNVFGGLMILASRSIRVGQRVTISTWQYGLLAPAYPPKFFSYDFLIPGITGRVVSVKLLYTTIVDDDNAVVEIPNGILVQAMLRTYGDSIVTRVKYEVPRGVDPEEALRRVKEAASRCSCVISEPSVYLDEVTSTGYVVAVRAPSRGNDQEACKSEILASILREFSAAPRS